METIKTVISEFDSYENDNYRIGAMAQVIVDLRAKLKHINDKADDRNFSRYETPNGGDSYNSDQVNEILNEILHITQES